jgi:hypothetical protein
VKSKVLAASCQPFVSHLFLRTHNQKTAPDKYYPLHSATLKKCYTSRHWPKDKMAILDKLKAVERQRGKSKPADGSYTVGEKSKGYRLAACFRKNVSAYDVIAPSLEARLDRVQTAASVRDMAGPALSWILLSYQQVGFSPAVDGLLRTFEFKSKDASLAISHSVDQTSVSVSQLMPVLTQK